MPDIMNYLRMANIFGVNPRQQQSPFDSINFGATTIPDPTGMGNTFVASPDDYDAGARMRELYTPAHDASDRYEGMVDAYPKQEDYKPSMLRRIGAALIATGQSFGPRGFQANPQAMESGMNFLNEPYNKQYGDWKNQIGPAQNAANLERQENTNNRTLAYQTVNQELSQRKSDTAAKNAEAKTKISADRAEVYRLKSLMPQHKFDFSGPNVMVADVQTGEVKDTGIPTGSLSDADKLALQQQGRVDLAHVQGNEQRATEGVRQDNRQELAWSEPLKVDLPDGSVKYIQTNKADGSVREVPIPGLASKIGGPGKNNWGNTPDSQKKFIQQKSQDILTEISNLLDDKGNLTQLGKDATSRIGIASRHIPQSEAYKGVASLKRVLDSVTIDLMQEMKAASKTGATGFGQMAVRELNVLQSAAAKLDPSLGPDVIQSELKRIRERLQQVLQPDNSYDQTTLPKPPRKYKAVVE